MVGFGGGEVGQDEIIPPSLGCIQNGRSPFLGTIDDPVLKLSCDLAQDTAADRIEIAVGSEETDVAVPAETAGSSH